MTSESEERRRSRHRSPGYPHIGLEDAIKRARALYHEDKMNSVAIDVASVHWGYKAGSSSGLLTVATLKKFGLVEDEGTGANRSIRITERARRIILDSENREELVREAALSPPIHADLHAHYSDGLPSDDGLRRFLLVERRFNERAVNDFIDQFRGTLEFAGILDSDTLSVDGTDKGERQEQPTMASIEAPTAAGPELERALAPVPTAPAGLRVFSLPISRRQQVILHVPLNLDKAGWDQMIAVLTAMKPGILADEEHEAED